ncbi:UNVERIFIED_CONTAM: hypothetical protein Scaly_0045600 [Sesamum calycinum]|uniref:Reverse transcriptase zinc-binding domain-containing protein n=1 Tax=Sesamum calycinum TaxID=2727403 RepID=A0AAW2SU59_9LAMI
METLDNPGKHTLTSAKARALFYRAVFDKLLINHFGCEIIDERKVHWVAWSKLGSRSVARCLGFRELRAFNLPMLAKQCWRRFTNPSNFLGRPLRARYFPNTSFLEATLSSRLSLTWRNLMSARPLMVAGFRWRVGSGDESLPPCMLIDGGCFVVGCTVLEIHLIGCSPPKEDVERWFSHVEGNYQGLNSVPFLWGSIPFAVSNSGVDQGDPNNPRWTLDEPQELLRKLSSIGPSSGLRKSLVFNGTMAFMGLQTSPTLVATWKKSY